jgi:threonine synthase
LYFPETITPLAPILFFDTIENLNEEIAYQAIQQFVGDEIPEITQNNQRYLVF